MMQMQLRMRGLGIENPNRQFSFEVLCFGRFYVYMFHFCAVGGYEINH
jgi:hypothetical protein